MSAWTAGLDLRSTSSETDPEPLDNARRAVGDSAAPGAKLDSQFGRPHNARCGGPFGKDTGQTAQHGQRIKQLGHENLAAKFLSHGQPAARLAQQLVQWVSGRSVI